MPTDLLCQQKKRGRSCHLTSSTTIQDYLSPYNWTMLLRSVAVILCISPFLPMYIRDVQEMDDGMVIRSDQGFFFKYNFLLSFLVD